MTLVPGVPISIADYNVIVASINAIFGTGTGDSGYGGNTANVAFTDLPTKSAGEIITSVDWLNLRNAQFDMGVHQGTTQLLVAIPDITSIEDADLCQAFEDPDQGLDPGAINSSSNFSVLTASKDVVSPLNVTVATKLTSVRGTAWSSLIQHEFTVTFVDSDDARHFFNTGGQLRLSASRTGGSATAQNANWDTILALGGTFIFGQDAYFTLTGDFQSIPPFGHIIEGVPYGIYYGTNSWTISSRREGALGPNGGNGFVIRFKSSFLDGHFNAFFDSVDGTFTSTVEERRSTGIFVRPTPTFATTIPLTAGS